LRDTIGKDLGWRPFRTLISLLVYLIFVMLSRPKPSLLLRRRPNIKKVKNSLPILMETDLLLQQLADTDEVLDALQWEDVRQLLLLRFQQVEVF
jgi:hypothetical protein